MERFPVAGGSELLTVFGTLPDAQPGEPAELPLVSVLRDNLGDRDPENDRLRYVWVLTSTRPGLLQRAEGALPFFYWHPDLLKNAGHRPAPVLDLGSTSRHVWDSLAQSLTQVVALDPNGAWVRSSTRSYRNNLEDHRRVQLLEGLAVLSQLEDLPEVRTLLSEPELRELETRLTLAGETMGGLVSADHLPAAYIKQRTRSEEMRGHNWELLRQRAEVNGLYFEPFGLNGSSTHALLWIAREDLSAKHKFDGQFLGISDPYRDPRLEELDRLPPDPRWKRHDPAGVVCARISQGPAAAGGFSGIHSPKRREMIRHAATDTVSGVLGISKFGNWPYLRGIDGLQFRPHAARRGQRSSGTSKGVFKVREWLALDGTIDGDLRAALRSGWKLWA